MLAGELLSSKLSELLNFITHFFYYHKGNINISMATDLSVCTPFYDLLLQSMLL